jgi:hypothetical protein
MPAPEYAPRSSLNPRRPKSADDPLPEGSLTGRNEAWGARGIGSLNLNWPGTTLARIAANGIRGILPKKTPGMGGLVPTIPALNGLGWLGFEHWVAQELSQSGWTILFPTPADHNPDLVAAKEGMSWAISCKHTRNNRKVPSSSILETEVQRRHWGCDHGSLITNGFLSGPAQTLALQLGILTTTRPQITKPPAWLDKTRLPTAPGKNKKVGVP